MKITAKEYQNKVRGCWLGKNIGGSLGAPFECKRGVFDVNFYTHDTTLGALPNDDLDLQLVWLNAAEKFGKSVNSQILGEYWTSYISADWSEYGAGKNNLRMGLLPPISGYYNNHNKNSCGCFIRSEIWACLAPGHPEIAVKYAYEDAIVDHSDEGVYAEIFCAAVESAAFAEHDLDKLMKIGLSYIPKDCGVATAINMAVDCYNSGKDWKAARKKILQTVPGSFGMYCGYEDREVETDIPIGELGYDAPSNIGIMMLGWLYGEGNFSKSLCLAASCGEDADCTAATLGSIMGIIHGADALPKKWLDPIGDDIKTISINLTNSAIRIPKTITELSRRVCALMPIFMTNLCDTMNCDGTVIYLNESDDLFDKPEEKGVFATTSFTDFLKRQPFGVNVKNAIIDVILNYNDGITIHDDTPKKISVSVENVIRQQQWITLKWYLPNDWNISPSQEMMLNLDQVHGGSSLNHTDFIITPHNLCKGKYDVILEIKSNGRVSTLFVPVTFIVG